jgi:hypothetical protein
MQIESDDHGMPVTDWPAVAAQPVPVDHSVVVTVNLNPGRRGRGAGAGRARVQPEPGRYLGPTGHTKLNPAEIPGPAAPGRRWLRHASFFRALGARRAPGPRADLAGPRTGSCCPHEILLYNGVAPGISPGQPASPPARAPSVNKHFHAATHPRRTEIRTARPVTATQSG